MNKLPNSIRDVSNCKPTESYETDIKKEVCLEIQQILLQKMEKLQDIDYVFLQQLTDALNNYPLTNPKFSPVNTPINTPNLTPVSSPRAIKQEYDYDPNNDNFCKKRPIGRAPNGMKWDYVRGKWTKKDAE